MDRGLRQGVRLTLLSTLPRVNPRLASLAIYFGQLDSELETTNHTLKGGIYSLPIDVRRDQRCSVILRPPPFPPLSKVVVLVSPAMEAVFYNPNIKHGFLNILLRVAPLKWHRVLEDSRVWSATKGGAHPHGWVN